MLKKILFYISLLLFFISCDAQIARNQFERGEYRESIKTTLKIAGDNKYTGLSLKEKEEILKRFNTIDSYYKSLENTNNVQIKYDAFAVGYMVNRYMPEVLTRDNYLTRYTTNRLASNLEYSVARNINMYSKGELETLANIQKDMRDINIYSSEYSGMYKGVSRMLADKFFSLYKASPYEDEQLKYLKLTYTTYQDFDSNYLGSKSKYYALVKTIDIRNANEYLNDARRDYNFADYERAIDKFDKAYEIFNKYSDYRYILSDIDVYREVCRNRIKQSKAQEYYERGLYYQSRGDYKRAAEAFYNAHRLVDNYKGSYRLYKENKEKSNYERTYTLSTNTGYEKEAQIERILARYGYTKVSYGANINLKYFQNVDYDQDNTKETVTVSMRVVGNGIDKSRQVVKISRYMYNGYMGLDRMLNFYRRDIDQEFVELINSVGSSLR